MTERDERAGEVGQVTEMAEIPAMYTARKTPAVRTRSRPSASVNAHQGLC